MTTAHSVSVITPCYNGSRYLRATIASVLAQTYPALEMIVVDDGSTDDSAAIGESFGRPVRVIRQSNQGESVARNMGIAEARGSYLMFLDADDLLHPSALEELAAAAAGGVAVMGVARFTADPSRPDSVIEARWREFFPTVIETNFGPPHMCLYPTEIVRRVGGYNAALRWSEDWDFVAQVALTGVKLTSIPLVGAYYRIHAKSQFATNSLANRSRGHVAVLERLGNRILERPELLEDHGERLFWALWTSVRRAREKGVSWSELVPAARLLRQLATVGPRDLREGRLAAMIRLLGARWAVGIHSMFNRQSSWEPQASAALAAKA